MISVRAIGLGLVGLAATVFAQTAVETRGMVDHAAWRAVQLCLLVFLLALSYRFLVKRALR